MDRTPASAGLWQNADRTSGPRRTSLPEKRKRLKNMKGEKNMKLSKSVVTTGLAAALAAAMVIGGGTFAYLKSASDDVTNTFNANKVLVGLKETTGSEYNIIPGSTQKKDPTITVDNTADSYVYAIVTDNLGGLVDYEIADGWTLLNGWDGAHTKVYYREVGARDTTKSFPVLKNNQVSYDAALENSDMLEADGGLKDGLNLTFAAYAMQKAPFADAKAAFETGYAAVDTSAGLEQALEEGKTAVLTQNVQLDATFVFATGEVNIMGNGNKIMAPATPPEGYSNRVVDISDQNEPTVLHIKDAELVGPTTGSYTRGISVYQSKDVTINMEDSALSANYYAFNFAFGNENVTINCKNSTIEGWAALNTHTPGMDVTFENCTLIGTNTHSGPTDGFATIVVDDAAGNPSPTGASGCTFTLKDCRIEANQEGTAAQYLMSVRAVDTTVTAENCTFFVNGQQIEASQEALAPYVSVYEDALSTFTFTIR